MKKQPQINVKLNEELLKKLLIISKAEGRSPNNQFIFMLRNNIQYFERTKGKISAKELGEVDISEYLGSEE